MCMCDYVHTEFENYYQKSKFLVFSILKSNINFKENSLEKTLLWYAFEFVNG